MRPKHTEGGRIHDGCSPLRGWVLVRYASALIGDYGLARKGCSMLIRKALRLTLCGGEPRVAGRSAVV